MLDLDLLSQILSAVIIVSALFKIFWSPRASPYGAAFGGFFFFTALWVISLFTLTESNRFIISIAFIVGMIGAIRVILFVRSLTIKKIIFGLWYGIKQEFKNSLIKTSLEWLIYLLVIIVFPFAASMRYWDPNYMTLSEVLLQSFFLMMGFLWWTLFTIRHTHICLFPKYRLS